MNDLTHLTMARRRFLQAALVTGAAALVPEALRFGEAKAASSVGPGEGILVLVMLGGGNDGLNMVAPATNGTYQKIRRGLALNPATALPLDDGLYLHPNLPNLKRRWDQKMLAVVRGVGYANPNLSHFESMANWQAGWGGGNKPGTGWIGRWLDTLADPDAMRVLSIGGSVPPHLRGSNHSGMSLPGDLSNAFGAVRDERWKKAMIDLVYSYGDSPSERGAWADQVAHLGRDTIDLSTRVAPIYDGLDGGGLARDLKLVGKFINANVGVRVFSVELGGFDTHSGQSYRHGELMRELDDGIEALFRTLSTAWSGQVTLMTFSEFGRRPEMNDTQGTDHGTASPLFVVGQTVRGGFHSEQPSIDALDENGNLRNTCDFRQVYSAFLGKWLNGDADRLVGKHYEPIDLFRSVPSGSTGAPANGYWTVSTTGAVHAFGQRGALGSAPAGLNVTGITGTADGNGYWLVTGDGTVYPFGSALHWGDMHGKFLARRMVDITATPTGKGYWLLGEDGGVFSFGDAQFFGSTGAIVLNKPVVGMCACPTGRGYWFVASDGGVFTYGPDARFFGSTGAMRLNVPIVSMAASPTGGGYWLVGSDGGVFNFGDAPFLGSTGGMKLNRPVIGIIPTSTGQGYWLVSSDGGVFTFGDAPFMGSAAGDGGTIVGLA